MTAPQVEAGKAVAELDLRAKLEAIWPEAEEKAGERCADCPHGDGPCHNFRRLVHMKAFAMLAQEARMN